MVLNLKEIRKRRGLTQEALSMVSNVNRANIAKYETNTSVPSLKTCEKLANSLGVTVDELIGKEGAKNDDPGD